jgi:hypothetical protein
MIADALYLVVAGAGFCQAAGRSIFPSGLTAGMIIVVTPAWIRGRRRFRRNRSASIKNS